MSGIAIPSYASLAASVRRHQGTAATLAPDDAETKPDVVILACTQCADLNRARHELADQDARTRRELAWSQIDLATALDRNRALDATITRLTLALDTVTHGFEPGPVIKATCGRTGCNLRRDSPVHRTPDAVLRATDTSPHRFAPGAGMWCCFPVGGATCGRQADDERHQVTP